VRPISTFAALLFAFPAAAAHLTPAASRAFDAYVQSAEPRALAAQPGGAPDTRIDPVNGGTWSVPGGLIHHWRGIAFAPEARAADMLGLLHDRDHLERYYAPDVVYSRVIGPDTVLMRFKKQRIITVVIDAEFQTRSATIAPGRGYSLSRSTHVWQVERPGTPAERRLPEGDDDGYLWRLNSYWTFRETAGGLFIQCEAISLTRDVPAGLGWLLNPIIQTLPRASLEFTLNATRNALTIIAAKEAHQ